MPVIHFARGQFPDITVESGSQLMQSLVDKDVPVASSCGGEGICSKCKVKVIAGAQNLSSATQEEVDLKISNNIPLEQRISCQSLVLGDISIDTGYW